MGRQQVRRQREEVQPAADMGAGYSDQNNFLELTSGDLPAMSVDGKVLDITEMVIPDGYTMAWQAQPSRRLV